MAFTHLHFHTVYSLLDGYNKISPAISRIKELGMTACAITDHGTLGGIPQWQEECEKQGIKPLLGEEGYYTPNIEIASLSIEERTLYAISEAYEHHSLTDYIIAEHNLKEYSRLMKEYEEGKITAKAFVKEYSILSSYYKPFEYNMKQYHILFIAKNNIGWHNLIKLHSESARLCTYNGRPLCDMNLIKQYSEGLICTCACLGSYPAHMIMEEKYDLADKYIKDMVDIFKDDFYLEIQPLKEEDQYKVNLYYMDIASKYNIKTVATNDCHWTYKEDYDDHDTLLCIGTKQFKTEELARNYWERKNKTTKKEEKELEKKGKTKESAEFKYNRMKYANEFWIRSEEEMKEAFSEQLSCIVNLYYGEDTEDSILSRYTDYYLSAMANTQDVVDKVEENIKLGSDKPLFPKIKVPKGYTPEEWLTLQAYRGLYKYLKDHPECDVIEYEKRLQMELNVINPKGFAPYMLVVQEYANWADNNDVDCGPGRGSAGGSLVLFCIGITKNIDPIKYDLLFSRFLTIDRMSPPDWKIIA